MCYVLQVIEKWSTKIKHMFLLTKGSNEIYLSRYRYVSLDVSGNIRLFAVYSLYLFVMTNGYHIQFILF
jgi:hypothetical protein